MKLGMSAFAWTSNLKASHLESLPATKEQVLSGVEIPIFNPDQLSVEPAMHSLHARLIRWREAGRQLAAAAGSFAVRGRGEWSVLDLGFAPLAESTAR